MTQPAGNLNKRITFMRRATTKGSRGQLTGAWSKLAAVSAEATELAGRELEVARKRYAAATMLFRLRLPRAFTPTTADQIVYNGATYDIGALYDPDQQQRDLIAACSAVR